MKKISDILYQLFAVYIAEFKVIFHDAGIILFLLVLPLVYPVIYSLIYNPEVVRDVKMVVVDHDCSLRSRELVRKLDATQNIRVVGFASNIEEAKHAIHSHQCFGILEIPKGFQRSIGRGESANAVLYSDMSLLLRYRGFLMAATEVAQEMGNDILTENITSLNPVAGEYIAGGDLLSVKAISMGNVGGGFDSFIMPGVVILILHQCIILSVGMLGGAARERRKEREFIIINKMTSLTVSLIGQTLSIVTVIALPMLFLVYFIPMIFSFPMVGNLFEIIVFLLPMVLSAIFMGFCIQSVISERESIFIIWVVTSVILIFLSGLTWPRYAMSPLWLVVGDIFPATWGIEGFIRMNTNGASLAQVSHCYWMLWILTAVYFILAWCLQKFIVHRKYFDTSKVSE